MPKQMFISPKSVIASLEATKPIIEVELVEKLGPSAPHDQPALEAPAVAWTPHWPKVEAAQLHYTNTLDDLWPEFDDLEERTAARLMLLLRETMVEAQRVLKLKEQVWDELGTFEIEDSEKQRINAEVLDYLRRLNGYRQILVDLDLDSTQTEDVYIGLVKRQEGAGPVPDAIMHMYFADQLGILAEHADDMGKSYVGRVMAALDELGDLAGEAADYVQEATQDKAEQIRELVDDANREAREDLRRLGLWVGGAIAGTIILGGAVTAGIIMATRGRDK